MMIHAKVNSLIEKLSDLLMKKGKALLLNRRCSQVEQLFWCLHIASRKNRDFQMFTPTFSKHTIGLFLVYPSLDLSPWRFLSPLQNRWREYVIGLVSFLALFTPVISHTKCACFCSIKKCKRQTMDEGLMFLVPKNKLCQRLK